MATEEEIQNFVDRMSMKTFDVWVGNDHWHVQDGEVLIAPKDKTEKAQMVDIYGDDKPGTGQTDDPSAA